MSEFEDFIKAKYPVDYESLKEKYPNVPVVEFYGDELDVWNHQQAKIDQLKAENEKLELELSQTKQVLHNVIDIERSNVEKLKAEKAGLEESINHISEMNFKSISFEHDLFDKGWNQASRQNVENIFRLTGVGESRLKALRGARE